MAPKPRNADEGPFVLEDVLSAAAEAAESDVRSHVTDTFCPSTSLTPPPAHPPHPGGSVVESERVGWLDGPRTGPAGTDAATGTVEPRKPSGPSAIQKDDQLKLSSKVTSDSATVPVPTGRAGSTRKATGAKVKSTQMSIVYDSESGRSYFFHISPP